MTTIAQYRMRNTAYVFTLTSEGTLFRGIVSTLVTGQFDRPVSSADFETEDQARDWLNAELAGRPYLMGDKFTVADGYLFTTLGWTKYTGIDLGKWPALVAYVGRVAARPKVQAALKAEGLAG